MTRNLENGQIRNLKLRVLLADESASIRRSLREALEPLSWVELVGETDRSEHAIAFYFQLRPDVIVVSTCISDHGGFEVLRCVKNASPNSAVILTTRRVDPFVAETARLLGASAVCHVTDDPAQVLKLLRDIAEARESSSLEPNAN
jgi:DNA-binding NarL/FixJ family response regulator